MGTAGCSIPVVRTIRVRVDWVRFPAARPVQLLASQNVLGAGMVDGHIRFLGTRAGLPVAASAKTGCSIPVVRMHGVHVDRVQFPAARPLLRPAGAGLSNASSQWNDI